VTDGPEPVAVIGAACRLPGARDLDGFWDLLSRGREAVTPRSEADLLAAGVTALDLADPDYVRAVLLTPDVDTFDAEFFGLSEFEADTCDPQLRIFLETAHAAVENAGHDITTLRYGTALFGAANPGRYHEIHLSADAFQAAEHARVRPDLAAFTSGRLGLRGPSVTLGSCSLLAVHQAVQALQAEGCDLALAGGVHVEMPYGHGYRWRPGGNRPPDGHSRPFDAAAAGCVYGSGAGVAVLKRLSEAIADGDNVLAVILAGAAGHAGHTAAPGLPAADRDGWAEVVAEGIGYAGCQPGDLWYVECAGAATPLGDARELAALAAGFRLAGDPPANGSVRIGSVTSNVGHLASAAGVAGLI
jgi:acyl transferase domain-containing protein